MAGGRRDAERLRTMAAGLLGAAPGSVPVSASPNGGYVPSSIPVTDTSPIRAPRAVELAGGNIDLPRFSWPGPVDSLDVSPGWLMDGPLNLVEAGVVMASGLEPIEFDILVNGSVIDTVVASAIDWQRYTIDVPVVLNDRVRLQMVDFGDGSCDDLSVVLRPFITEGQSI